MLTEHIQNFLNISPLLAAGVELAVRVCAGTTLAKAVVALRIYLLPLRYLRQVELALAHVLAPLHDDRTLAQLYETQGGEKTGWPLAHHHHLLCF